jgi:quercetin dioxygenase-like cupin family protein
MTQPFAVGGMIDMVGSRFEMVARMGDAPQDTALLRSRMAPGKTVPLHSHIDPECFYVLSGALELFLLDDAPRWHRADAGQSLLAANGIRHASRNPTDQETDIMLATNNRFASFLSEAGRPVTADTPFAPPAPEDIQRVLRASAAYGYWNATPEESGAITG